MDGHFHFDIEKDAVRIDIDLHLDPGKAMAIGELLEEDAIEPRIDIFPGASMHRISGQGRIRKITLREIICRLAE